ncbi:2-oxo acid dehydrogenase subunit E2 [Paenalkalicoccus suaedae]|uniref:Dihydrolipoamide acetyltransferase component of pyruvate dehydrogenase complex n=1 Tax=Paenalkalicoccus suaedae TaxID=2592382 RepID=A0A859FDQ8_9BACI|nr:dihydrolipoamide acetyltransferase family protein [Paenalkalicoccus suaedae]QKS70981.1 2-oxo acid dehydrogenase subunit E2 [Paenalkalicoccus suaedae]
MATEITMPQLGESVTEGTITKWLVKPGDKVKKYDPLAEVMTDKVNAEVPSSYEGTVSELIANEDETVEVGKVICTIEVAGEETKAPSTSIEKSEPAAQSSSHPNEGASKANEDTSQKGRYSPAVLKLAQENDIDLQSVNGSGRGGRITRKDILEAIENPPAASKPAAAPSAAEPVKEVEHQAPKQEAPVSQTSQEVVANGRTIEVPVTGVRRAIAQNMVKSKHEAPHAWMMIEVDVTNLVKLRNSMKDSFMEQEGIKLTFLPFFMKATIDALKQFPEVNARWAEDKIIRHKDVHLSMAVATEEELFVPVIKNADDLNIKGLARSLNEIASKVRNKTLTSADMQGGTFTLNNTGSFGSIQSQPIINRPQAAILSVESIVKRPVVLDNDAIAIRHMVNLCMSLDHRVLDGLVCGKFMAHIKNSLENMSADSL